jgi:hypothetical protein
MGRSQEVIGVRAMMEIGDSVVGCRQQASESRLGHFHLTTSGLWGLAASVDGRIADSLPGTILHGVVLRAGLRSGGRRVEKGRGPSRPLLPAISAPFRLLPADKRHGVTGRRQVAEQPRD